MEKSVKEEVSLSLCFPALQTSLAKVCIQLLFVALQESECRVALRHRKSTKIIIIFIISFSFNLVEAVAALGNKVVESPRAQDPSEGLSLLLNM